MSFIIIFVSATLTLILHFLSRNLLYLFVGLAGMLTVIPQIYFENKKKLFCLISIVLNFIMFIVSLAWHFVFGGVINDYLIMSLISALYCMLTSVELIPTNKKCDE